MAGSPQDAARICRSWSDAVFLPTKTFVGIALSGTRFHYEVGITTGLYFEREHL
jgi:hypothetical protein